MWTLILTLVIAGHSINTVTVPNLPSKEICRQTVKITLNSTRADLVLGWVPKHTLEFTHV